MSNRCCLNPARWGLSAQSRASCSTMTRKTDASLADMPDCAHRADSPGLPALLALWPLRPGASAARPLGRCQKQGCRWLFACTSPTSITLFPPRPRPSPPPRSLMHVRPGFSPSSRRCSRPPRQLQHAATGADSSRCVATEQQSLALRRIQTDDASAGSYVAPANCRGGAKLGRESTAEPARSALASVRSKQPYALPACNFRRPFRWLPKISNLKSHLSSSPSSSSYCPTPSPLSLHL